MSIDQQWLGQSTNFGGTLLAPNTVLGVEEGYSDEYVEIGNINIDRVVHRRSGHDDAIGIQATSDVKKLDRFITDIPIDYSGYYYQYETFNGPSSPLPSTLSQSADTFSIGGTMLFGATPNPGPESLTFGRVARNMFMESGFKFPTASGYVRVGVRSGDSIAADPDKEHWGAILVSAGANQLRMQYQVPAGLTNALVLSETINANTDYYARAIAYENNLYGFLSTNSQTYSWAGSTYISLTDDFYPTRSNAWLNTEGYGYIGNANTSASYQYLKSFTYSKVWTVNKLIRDLSARANVTTYIPDLWSDFSAGFTSNGGNWSVSGDVLTAVGTSYAWDTYFTGSSFENFEMEVDVTMGVSSYAALIVGPTGTQFNTFWIRRYNTSDTRDSLLTTATSHEVYDNGDRMVYRFPPIADYPYGNKFTMGLIKNGADLHLTINGEAVFYTIGGSMLNTEGFNVVGLAVKGDIGVGATVQFENLHVRPLSTVVQDFVVDASQSMGGAIESLTQVQPFDQRMSGSTLYVIPSRNTAPVRTFNVGASSVNGQLVVKQDTDYNHVIVIGENGIRAEAFDAKSITTYGERLYTITDESLSSYDVCRDTAQKILNDSDNTSETYTLDTSAHPDLEKGDVVTVIDETTGVSQNYYIAGTQKSFTPNSFNESFELEKI